MERSDSHAEAKRFTRLESMKSIADELPRPSWRILVALLVMICLGLFVRVAFWKPGLGSDDARYLVLAEDLARGRPCSMPQDIAASRFGLEAAAALWIRTFGFTNLAASGLNIAVFAATALVLFFITVALCRDKPWRYIAGLLAVFFAALIPVDLFYAPYILPDPLATCLSLLAALLCLSIVQTAGGKQLRYAFACGLALGASASVKESSVFAGVVFSVYLWIALGDRRRWLPALAVMGAGAALVIAGEMVGFWLWTGDPLFRVRQVQQFQIAIGREAGKFNPLFYVREAFHLGSLLGLHGYLLALGIVLALVRGWKVAALPLIWCLVFGVYLSVGSASLTRYIPLPQSARYFQPVLVMGCALAAVELVAAAWRFAWKPATAILAALLLGTFAWGSLDILSRWDVGGGICYVSRQLAAMNEVEQIKLAIPYSYRIHMALDNRPLAQRFTTIKLDRGDGEKIFADLAGRGLVVPQCWGCGEDDKWLKKNFASRFDVQELTVDTTWPLYRRWFRVGPQERFIGRIWWPKPLEGKSK